PSIRYKALARFGAMVSPGPGGRLVAASVSGLTTCGRIVMLSGLLSSETTGSNMRQTRRDFIKAGAVGAGALALGLQGCAKAEREAEAGGSGAPAAPLRILVLGGTGFIGPHMVRRARERGHT